MALDEKKLDEDLYSISNSIRVYKLPVIICSIGLLVCVMVFLLMVQNNMRYQNRNFNLVSNLEGKLIKARLTELFDAVGDSAKKAEQSFSPGKSPFSSLSNIAKLPEIKSAYLLSLHKDVNIDRVIYQQPDNDEAHRITKEIVYSDFMRNTFAQYVYLPTGATIKILNFRGTDKLAHSNYLIVTLGFAKYGKPWAVVYFIDIEQLISQIVKNERLNTDFAANIFLLRKFEDGSQGIIYEYYDDREIMNMNFNDKFSINRQIGHETFDNEIQFEYNQNHFSIIHIPTNDYLSSVVNMNIWLTLLSIMVIIGLISFFLFYLVTRNVKIQDLVTQRTAELTAATEDLAQKNEELIEINRELEDFTYIVSHDIRSPLINLKGFSDEIQAGAEKIRNEIEHADGNLSEEKRNTIISVIQHEITESITYIHKAVKSLDSMTSSILDFSRLGKIELKYELIDCKKMLDEIIARYSHQIKSRNIQIRIGKTPQFTSDYVSIREVFSNIIDNAIKYMPADREGRIEISGKAMPDSKYMMFTIRDNGAGISNEAKKKVFQILRRATLDKTIPGHGMGMPFVRSILKKLRGRIWFKSILGKGTTFYFVVPDVQKS